MFSPINLIPLLFIQTFYKTLLQRHERDVLVVFEKFCTGEPKRNVMNSKEFLHFLNSSQVLQSVSNRSLISSYRETPD